MSGFQSKNGTVPFPRSAGEWEAKGLSPADAEHKMRQDVFGHDYTTDKSGAPIERGKGSAAQPTAQHLMAKSIGEDAERSRQMRMGWHPGLEQSFNPKAAPRARRKTGKRKTAAAPAEGNA